VRILITLITSLCLTLPAYAQPSVRDLPYIEGTPLEQTSEEGPTWTLLDYAEADGSLAWAWLENAGLLAYVVYPSSTEAVVFPDGVTVDSDPENMVLRFLGDVDQRLAFTRLGGSVVSKGRDISMVYTAAPIDLADEGIHVELLSSGSISIADAIATATLTINVGEIISIEGTGSSDTLTPNPTCLQDNDVTISSIGAEDISYKTPCSGDFLISAESWLELLPPSNSDFVILEAEEIISGGEPVSTDNKQIQSSPQKKSSGGSTSGMILGFLTLIALFRRKLS
jgi:hypothetical protein